MTVLDKHRLIVSPALAPTELRDGDEFDHRQNAAETTLTIGLVNNMPDAALQATERQFTQLLKAGAGNSRIHLHCFSLPSVKRSQQTQRLIASQYTDIADLGRLQIDGLIVTGAEPNAEALDQEPFWQDLTGIIDWAKANTRSTIWSCLAAHAAVLHLDGIERQRLETKCSGVFDCAKVSDHWMTRGITSPLKIPHSRLNALKESDLAARGYQLLTRSPEAGVDIFARQLGSQFIFFHGHPEYDALSLQREYLRDITRFIGRERETYPAFPSGYFNRETEIKLARFGELAIAERTLPLSVELPPLTLRSDIAVGTAAAALFGNWLGYLTDGAARR
jgi:homoserine O-succinyltransferase/O-acetyltransferase